jgi:ABC-type lipoprotein export system ATPase subunit
MIFDELNISLNSKISIKIFKQLNNIKIEEIIIIISHNNNIHKYGDEIY